MQTVFQNAGLIIYRLSGRLEGADQSELATVVRKHGAHSSLARRYDRLRLFDDEEWGEHASKPLTAGMHIDPLLRPGLRASFLILEPKFAGERGTVLAVHTRDGLISDIDSHYQAVRQGIRRGYYWILALVIIGLFMLVVVPTLGLILLAATAWQFFRLTRRAGHLPEEAKLHDLAKQHLTPPNEQDEDGALDVPAA